MYWINFLLYIYRERCFGRFRVWRCFLLQLKAIFCEWCTFQRCRDLLTHAYGIGKNSAFGASSVLRLLVLCGQRLLSAHRVLTEGKAAQTQQQKTHADIPVLIIVCSLIPQYTTVGCVDVLSFLFYVFILINEIKFRVYYEINYGHCTQFFVMQQIFSCQI